MQPGGTQELPSILHTEAATEAWEMEFLTQPGCPFSVPLELSPLIAELGLHSWLLAVLAAH